MEIRNCKHCGKLFNYTDKPLCPECIKAREEQFQEVKKYIRDNPTVGIAEVAENTGVTVNQIRQWIRQERLELAEPSADVGINCEGCGRPIVTGRLCQNCKKQMKNALTSTFVKEPDDEKRKGLKSSGKDKMRFLSKDNL